MNPELALRRDLNKAMSGYWVLDWHEDREINPGVPDISFVMRGGKCETGWIELKAIRRPVSQLYSFKLEPSQPPWFREHHDVVPTFFYLRVEGVADFLVPGKYYNEVALPITDAHLREISVCVIDPKSITPDLPRELRKATDRTR